MTPGLAHLMQKLHSNTHFVSLSIEKEKPKKNGT